MELTDAIRRRRMVRSYRTDSPPSRAQIDHLLDLAVRAPSAGFSQGWHFLVLESDAARAVFWNASSDSASPSDPWLEGMKSAPVLIIALSEPSTYLARYAEADKGWADRDVRRWPVPYWDVDTGMASLLMLLGAVDLGLSGCFFGVPVEALQAVKVALGIPADRHVVGVISIGYAAPDRRSPSLKRGRRPVHEVSSWNQFGAAQPVSRETTGDPAAE